MTADRIITYAAVALAILAAVLFLFGISRTSAIEREAADYADEARRLREQNAAFRELIEAWTEAYDALDAECVELRAHPLIGEVTAGETPVHDGLPKIDGYAGFTESWNAERTAELRKLLGSTGGIA